MLNSLTHRLTRTAVATAAVLALSLLAPSPASAEGGAKLTITPATPGAAYIDITAQPGETTEVSVSLANTGGVAATARTYAADASTTVNGGLGAALFGSPRTGPTTWLSYPDETLRLDPGQRVTRKVSIAVPASVSAGQHLSSLVIENSETEDSGSASAKQRLRHVIAVMVTVPGPVQASFTVGAVGHDTIGERSIISISLTNDGPVLVKPAGSVTITDASGAVIVESPAKMGSLYAGNTAKLEVPLASLMASGEYVAAVRLSDAASGVERTADLPLRVEAPEAAVTEAAKRGLAEVRQVAAKDAPAGAPAAAVERASRTLPVPDWALGAVGALLVVFAVRLVGRRRQRAALTAAV